MSNLERGFCSLSEYRQHVGQRISEDELVVDELYLMMVALKSSERSKRAAKLPTRITDLDTDYFDDENDRSGLIIAELSIFNVDLTPDFEVEATFVNGFWHKGLSEAFSYDKKNVHAAYLRDFSSAINFRDGIHELVNSQIERPLDFVPLEPVNA